MTVRPDPQEHRKAGAVNVDKDRVAGAAKQAKGAIKDVGSNLLQQQPRFKFRLWT
jgi:hypothetical protein